jgi:hypothetical protein
MFVRYKYLEENGIVHDRVALARAIENLGFPKPVALAPNTLAWRLSEVEEWIQSRPRVSTKGNALRSRGPKPLPPIVDEEVLRAAKVLGVDEGTIRKDLRNNSAESAEKIRAEPTPFKREAIRAKNEELGDKEVEVPRETFETIVIDPPWPMTKIERDVRPNSSELTQRFGGKAWLSSQPTGEIRPVVAGGQEKFR